MSLGQAGRSSPARSRAALTELLRERRREIEGAILARVYSLQGPSEVGDPAYLQGLRQAIGAAVDYGIEAVGRDEARPAPIPTPLLAQAREAARNGVSLDTVLRRYCAGHALLGDFLHEEAERSKALPDPEFRRLRRDQAALLDRLLATISQEYEDESAALCLTPAGRRAQLVERLLAGELLDTAELAYEFECWHVAILLAQEDGALATLHELAASCERRLLLVEAGRAGLWAWLGGRGRPDCEEIASLAVGLDFGTPVAFGEPGWGLQGWRLSHRQAAGVLPVALHAGVPLVRYGEAALLGVSMRDEVLSAHLRQRYLDPLGKDNTRELLCEALGAYLAAGCNASSAAASLGIARNTLANRLRAAERRIGSPLAGHLAELQVALGLKEVELRRPFAEVEQITQARTSGD